MSAAEVTWAPRLSPSGVAPWSRYVISGEFGPGRIELPAGDATIVLSGASLKDADLTGCVFRNYVATGSILEGCDFTDAIFEGGVLGDLPVTTYRRCTFRRTDLRRCNPQLARFEECLFEESRLDEWSSRTAEFVECRFTGRLLRVQFWGKPTGAGRPRVLAQRSSNEFRANDFVDAILDDCSFKGGIDLDANSWPTSDRYVVLRGREDLIDRALTRIDELPTDQRKPTLNVLKLLSTGGYEQQRDVIVERALLGPAAALLI
jgi:hypothetical protein